MVFGVPYRAETIFPIVATYSSPACVYLPNATFPGIFSTSAFPCQTSTIFCRTLFSVLAAISTCVTGVCESLADTDEYCIGSNCSHFSKLLSSPI